MAKASYSLPQASEPFQPISRTAICILARLAAKRAVQDQLRSDGVSVTLVRPAEIAAKANEYLYTHSELYDEARERAVRLACSKSPDVSQPARSRLCYTIAGARSTGGNLSKTWLS